VNIANIENTIKDLDNRIKKLSEGEKIAEDDFNGFDVNIYFPMICQKRNK